MSPLFSQAELDRTNGSIHLQGVGRVKAKPAGALSVGDRTVWNYGYVYVVDAIEHKPSGKTIDTVLRDEEDGKTYPRRFNVDRMVAVI